LKCPKCGYERRAADGAPEYECPNCGIIYTKFDPSRQAPHQRAAVKPPAPATQRGATAVCGACGGSVPSGARACAQCGSPIVRNRAKGPALALAGVLIAVGAALALSQGRPAKVQARAQFATASAAPVAASVNLVRCEGSKNYQKITDDYAAAHPEHAAEVREFLNTARVPVGMPESVLAVVGCYWIESVNVTQTAYGVRKQVVMSRDLPGLPRYIYIENGIVAATQSAS
jgi:hypothetical protein